MTTEFWRRWLLSASLGVALYAVGLVVAGPVATRVFDALGFGPVDSGVPDGPARDYVVFVYAVLGAVIVGWMCLVAAVAAGPLRTGEAWALPAVSVSIGVWFVLDTGASLVLGFWTHAVFNLGFVAVVGLPLARLGRVTPELHPDPHPR